MTTMAATQQDLIDEFSIFDDWQEKYAYIIDLGRELPPLEASLKDEDHKVKGCQSQVWLSAELKEGRVQIVAESDALIVQGLIAVLLRVFHDRPPQEILDANLGFLDEVGLISHLSMNRTNGLNSMVKQIKAYALAFLVA